MNARRLSAILITCLLSTATAVTVAHADDVADYLAKGQEAFNRADIVDAMRWYRKAAEAGSAEGQLQLARHLDYSEQNEEAVAWYQKAADQGHPEAQHELGGLYASGEGVEKDPEKAIHWITRAAEQGHAASMRSLATAYISGQLGLAPDPAKALAWLERGAQAKDHWSVVRLAEAHRKGELGLPADPARADQLLSESGIPSPPKKK